MYLCTNVLCVAPMIQPTSFRFFRFVSDALSVVLAEFKDMLCCYSKNFLISLFFFPKIKNTYRLPTNLANSGRFSHLGKDETIVLPQLTSNTPEQILAFIQTRLAFEMSTNCPYFCSSHSLFRIFLSPYTTKIYHVHFKGYKDSITIEHYQCTYKSCKTLISDSDRVAIFQIFEPIKYINRGVVKVTI